MKAMRLLACLFIIGLIFGCSGDRTQTGGSTTRGMAKVLADDLQITSDPNDQTQPSVAYDTVNKRYLVVWTDFRNVNLSCSGTVCGTDIFGKLCTGTGTGTATTMTCGSEFLISNVSGSPAPGNQTQPKVAYDIQNTKYLVVWTDSRNAGYTQIFGQYVNPDGTLNGNNTAITPHDTSGGPDNPQYLSQSEPSLVYNETTKNFDIAWLDNTDSDNVNTVTVQPAGCTNSEIITYIPLQFGADGNMVRTGEINGANPLTNAASIRDYTKLVFTKTSGFILTGPTGPIAASFETQVDETHPSIFYNKATGENFVAWQGRTNSVDFSQPFTVVAQTGSQTVVVQPPAHTVFLCTGAGSTTTPQNCWLPGDQVVASFSHPLKALPTFTLNDGTVVTGINTPGFLPGSQQTSITGILTAASNAVPPAATPTNNTGPITVLGSVDLGNLCNYGVQTWTVTDKDAGIQKIKVRQPTGTSSTGTLFKDLTFGTGNSFNPAITTDPNTQRALLVWEESAAATGKDINGFLIDLTNFTSYSTQISVTKAQGDQTLPAVSFDNVNQRFLVVWEDARNQSANISNIDIFSQFVDPQGNLSGANSPVTVAPGNQLAPALTFGDVDFRKFLVVWADGRQPSNADIFGQLMEFSLSSQLLIEDGAGAPILNSAIDFGNLPIGLTGGVLNSKTLPFKICNQGNTQLTINSMTQPDAPFSLTTPVPVTISPNVCVDMTAAFTPVAAGSYAGTPSNNFKTTINSDGGTVTLFFSGNGTGNQPLAVTTTSLPDASIGTPYSSTLAAFGGVFPYSWSITSGSLPPGLTLNASTGTITGTPTTAGSSSFTVQVTDNNAPVKHTATSNLSIGVSLVTITKAGLKPWTQGINYGNAPVETMTASGGAAPYSWTISAGSLPTGILLNNTTGVLTGVPTTSGVFTFTVKVTDSTSPTPQSATKSFSITINPASAILTSSLPPGVVGNSYTQFIIMAGGTSPFNWSISSGSLPPGLAIDTGTGVISGTPTAPGTYNFTVSVADGPGATASKNFSIQINSGLSIVTTSLPDTFINNNAYSQTLVVSGGRAPYLWSIASGVLPTGLALNVNTGIISGTPTVLGTFTFVVGVTDADQTPNVTKTFSITIFKSTDLFIATNTLDDTFVNRPYAQTLTAVGGVMPYVWKIASGSLPPGLNLDQNTGSISGTPTTSGIFSFTVQVTDSQGRAALTKLPFSITVVDASDVIITPSGSETVPKNKIKVLKAGDLPPLPSGFIMTKAVQYEIDGTGGQVLVFLTFNSLSSDPVFYNAKNGSLTKLGNCSSTADTDCIDSLDTTNRKLVLRILDNGNLDADPTVGVILDTLVAGYVSSGGGDISNSNSGGGGCSIGRKQNGPAQAADALVMLAPLFAIIARRNLRRKKK